MLELLPVLNSELEAEGKPPLSIGIGLNIGDAVVGHVGSHLRHDYSAIGDTTNVAARLEGLTKEVGYPLVCSEAVVSALGFPEGFVNIGERSIKGRSPMKVYGWREAEFSLNLPMLSS
jgi:adenylate cyclase